MIALHHFIIASHHHSTDSFTAKHGITTIPATQSQQIETDNSASNEAGRLRADEVQYVVLVQPLIGPRSPSLMLPAIPKE